VNNVTLKEARVNAETSYWV